MAPTKEDMMDQYGQVGPEKGSYLDDVANVADSLMAGKCVTLALTHRLTRQQVTLALKSRMAVYGASRGGGPPGTRGGLFVFVAVDEHGAYWFRIDLFIDSSYMADKLSVNRVDAETLCDFLMEVAKRLGQDPRPATSTVTVMHGGDAA